MMLGGRKDRCVNSEWMEVVGTRCSFKYSEILLDESSTDGGEFFNCRVQLGRL